MSDQREPEFEQAQKGQGLPRELEDQVVEGEIEALPPAGTLPRARLLPMWILIAGVVLVGVAWALSDRYFGESEMADKDVQLVVAEETPFKIRPEEPGGVAVPDRDKYVYKSLTEEEPDAEQLLPPPEEPMEVPSAVVNEEIGVQVDVLDEVGEKAGASEPGTAVEVQAVSETPPPPHEVAFADPKTFALEPENILSQSLVEEAEPVVGATVLAATGETTVALEEKADEFQPAAAPKPAETIALTAGTPGFAVQIGATQQKERAVGEIARLVEKHPEILGGLGSIVVRADLGNKGVWYRMRVGSFASRAEADITCGELKAVDIGCFVVTD